MASITFLVDRVFVKPMRSDDSFRVELDTGEYSLKAMQQLMELPKGVYKITIEPDVTEV